MNNGGSAPSDEKSEDPVKAEWRKRDPLTGMVYMNLKILEMSLSFTIVVILSYLFLTDKIRLHGRFTSDRLNYFSSKLEFMLMFQALHAFFLQCCVANVLIKRATRGALDPRNETESIILVERRLLGNSIEQYLIFLINQLVLVTFLSPSSTLRIIPLLNVLHILGRIAFALGYPEYRAFGFTLSYFPSFATSLSCIIYFLQSIVA